MRVKQTHIYHTLGGSPKRTSDDPDRHHAQLSFLFGNTYLGQGFATETSGTYVHIFLTLCVWFYNGLINYIDDSAFLKHWLAPLE
jgi:hypothetical protein